MAVGEVFGVGETVGEGFAVGETVGETVGLGVGERAGVCVGVGVTGGRFPGVPCCPVGVEVLVPGLLTPGVVTGVEDALAIELVLVLLESEASWTFKLATGAPEVSRTSMKCSPCINVVFVSSNRVIWNVPDLSMRKWAD